MHIFHVKSIFDNIQTARKYIYLHLLNFNVRFSRNGKMSKFQKKIEFGEKKHGEACYM